MVTEGSLSESSPIHASALPTYTAPEPSAPLEVVVDANLVIAWVLPNEPYHAQARRLLTDLVDAVLCAPPIYEQETDSVIRRSVYLKKMTEQDARGVLLLLDALPLEIVREPVVQGVELRRRAREIAELLDQPRVYDATYAALAEARGCAFWTADTTFCNAAAGKLSYVRFVGGY